MPLPGQASVASQGKLRCLRGRPAGEVVGAALAVEDERRNVDGPEQGGCGGVRDSAVADD